MLRIPCTVNSELPEEPSLSVNETQFLVLWSGITEAKVSVYFMENLAATIVDPHAVAVGPDISLRYSTAYRSGAVAAGVELKKLVFHFSGFTQRKYRFTLRRMKDGVFFG